LGIPDTAQADFDGDGITDKIIHTHDTITIEMSSKGIFSYSPKTIEGDTRSIQDFEVISLRKDGQYPSVVFATVNWRNQFFHLSTQRILFNQEGQFTVRELPTVSVGRDIDCIPNPREDMNPFSVLCFYSSYGDVEWKTGLSALIEINQEGRSRDVTEWYHLPFPQSVLSTRGPNNGFLMINSAFFDFNQDGLEDLIAVGQHSQILTAEMTLNEKFKNARYHSDHGEYLRISVPQKVHTKKMKLIPPCVYFTLEAHEGPLRDFVECYNQKTSTWNGIEIPGGPYFSGQHKDVIFWDVNGDGLLEFAAKTIQGHWNLLQVIPKDKYHHESYRYKI